ncbi:MAG: peptidyl-prolyl cis-trans isomerase [Gammaproteobacteria bacterium]|nr:peptidyl-prolyl cis-trans isomerase [Gammaproteobacteria bacterium]
MYRMRLGVGLCAVLLAFHVAAGNQSPGASQDDLFAQINDLTISKKEFEAIFQAAVRHKYYHGKVVAAELEDFRKQVVEDIVTQELVFRQAQKTGIQPDRSKIDAGVDAFNLKNANNQDWEARREKVVPRLIERLERQDLIEKMEARVRNVPRPNAEQVEQYYFNNPDKFTEPKRLWVSVILRKVSPASTENVWVEAEAALRMLKQRAVAGEDFGALARKHSEHMSAATGGDLGYLHLGVLEESVQQKIETLEVNQLSDPLRVLEGITLFRLNGVQPAKLKSFDEVKNRAADLLYRELQDTAWESYVDALKSSAYVYVND